MIYLAVPYSHADAAVRQQRFDAACRAAAALIRQGKVVFSPVSHGHAICSHGLPSDWAFWQHLDRHFLDICDEVVVLMCERRAKKPAPGGGLRRTVRSGVLDRTRQSVTDT